MRIPNFEMERMQSTWENLVAYDMSESGVRPVTLRELMALGLDLDAVLDMPLGYSQSNGTIELRETLALQYPGATIGHIEVTNGTSEANYLLALSLLRPEDEAAFELPNYMQLWGVARSLCREVPPSTFGRSGTGSPTGRSSRPPCTRDTKLVYLSNPNNPTGSVLSEEAMRRIAARCDQVGAWLIADEVYQGAEIDRPRTPSFWGMGERVIVTSGLSKAYGIPGVRIGWIVAPPAVAEACWSQHDYITIGPNKLSDRLARVAVEPANREKLYARTRDILRHNLPIAREWAAGFGGLLALAGAQAGAMAWCGTRPTCPAWRWSSGCASARTP